MIKNSLRSSAPPSIPKGVIRGSILRYNEDSGKYYVYYPGMNGNIHEGIPAVILSPTPFEDGGGLKSVPKVPEGTPCLLFQDGNTFYILGFVSTGSAVTHESHQPVRPIEKGESFHYHGTSSRTGFNSNGSWMAWVSDWVNMVLNPITQQFTAYLKRIFINLYSGFIKFSYDMKKKAGLFTLQIKKEFDESAYDATKIPRDTFTVRIGQIDTNEHILDFKVQQNYHMDRIPDFEAIGKLGQNTDGTFLDLSTTKGLPGNQMVYTWKSNISGKSEFNIQKTSSSTSLAGEIDPTAENVLNIRVNSDKAQLIVDKMGNVTIKTTPGSNIFLGGTKSEQKLVTENWITQVFTNHIHNNGNNGSPTTPPLPSPKTISLNLDSKTNHLTNTTRVE